MPMPTSSNPRPPYSTSPMLNQLDCIRHGFYGAQGGISKGIYSSLNCGHSSLDQTANVNENRRRVAAQIGVQPHRLFSLKQAHTTQVVHITAASEPQFNIQADGMVSADHGVALGSLGADCAPVLFVDPLRKVIGAAHSGWKGALDGINEAVIEHMLILGAQRDHIHASIGPAMQWEHYEVQADFQAMFAQHSSIDASPFFHTKGEKLYFDTPAYICVRLQKVGIRHLDRSKEDTFSQPDKYFSYRRSCQQGETDYGRQIAAIALTAT